jgi:ABC-2 type transport system permease protein
MNTTASLSLPDISRLPRHVSLRTMVHQIWLMAGRAITKAWRTPEQFFDIALQPLLFTPMFGYIFGGAISGSVKEYLPILIPGIIVQTVLSASMATGVQLRDDMDKGVFDRFKSLPMARIAILAGPAVADLIRYSIATCLTLLVGMLMGYRPGGGIIGTTAAVGLVVAGAWCLAWIFTFVGAIARTSQGVQSISMMILMPLTFLSNAYVPVNTLPGWLAAFVKVNPVSHIVSAIRSLANEGQFTSEVAWAILGCVVVVSVFMPLAVVAYKRKC